MLNSSFRQQAYIAYIVIYIVCDINICIVHLSFTGQFIEQANWLEFLASHTGSKMIVKMMMI